MADTDIEMMPPPGSHPQAPVTPGRVDAATVRACVMHPTCLAYLPYQDIGRLALVSRMWCFLDDSQDELSAGSMWGAVCSSFASEHGVYLPDLPREQWRDYFFSSVTPLRRRWDPEPAPEAAEAGASAADTLTADAFKLRVSVRFRPGTTGATGVTVPLHQRLMITKSGDKAKLLAMDPPEFRDALLGGVMHDPVLLPHSGKVCERKVVMMHLKKHSRDPFTKAHLTAAMLVPQADLREKIRQWRTDVGSVNVRDREHLKVGAEGLQELTKKVGSNDALELFDAVLDAERLLARSRKRKRPRAGRGSGVDDGPDDMSDGDADDVQADGSTPEQGDAQPGGEDAAADEVVTDGYCVLKKPKGAGVGEGRAEEGGGGRERERPRVLDVGHNKVVMFQPGKGAKPFVFNNCWKGGAEEEVYASTAQPAVVAALNGKNACMLCYGQTGSGKTHTMFGPDRARPSGVALSAMHEMLSGADQLRKSGVVTTMTARYVQVYCRRVSCLLSGAPIDVFTTDQAGVPALHLKNCQSREVHIMDDVYAIFSEGESRKRFAETRMNSASSRSHSLLMVEVVQTHTRTGRVQTSQLTLADLAGSERVKKSGAAGGTLFREAISINQSLLSLGRCIQGLVREHTHLPFRESKLTQLLEPALIGGHGCVTSVVVCCRMDDDHSSETLQSLMFGETCAAVSTKARAAVLSTTSALSWIDGALEQMRRLALQPNADEAELLHQVRVLQCKRDSIIAAIP